MATCDQARVLDADHPCIADGLGIPAETREPGREPARQWKWAQPVQAGSMDLIAQARRFTQKSDRILETEHAFTGPVIPSDQG